MSETTWPTCFRASTSPSQILGYCAAGTPGRFHHRAGKTAEMLEVRRNACARHIFSAQQQTLGYQYRETRAAEPGDVEATPAEHGEQLDLFGGQS